MKRVLLLGILTLFLCSCAVVTVDQSINPGVQPEVRKEMIKNEQKRIKEKRELDKIHRQRARKVTQLQRKDWK